jgi:hypothetical protein
MANNKIWKRKKTFTGTGTVDFLINVAHDQVTVRASADSDDMTFTVEELDPDGDVFRILGYSSFAGSGAGGTPDFRLEADSDSRDSGLAVIPGSFYKLRVKATSLGTGAELVVVVSAEESAQSQRVSRDEAVEVSDGTGGTALR